MPVLPAYWQAICPHCLYPYGPDFTTQEEGDTFQTVHPTCHDCRRHHDRHDNQEATG